jgi:pyruvate,water dikinase
VSRDKTHTIIALNLVHKRTALRLSKGGGTEMADVEIDRRSKACLHQDQLQELAEAGLLIERYFNCPQDIEFTFNRRGKLIILQARRLNVQPATEVRPEELAELKNKYPVIMHNRGEVAQKGIGIGPVYKIRKDKDLDSFPAGAILVARYASPILAKVMPLAAGIITDIGSTTGHLATVAREFRVPCLLNTENSTAILQSNLEITLDTEENIIYQGQIKELQAYSFIEDDINETPEYRLLRRVLRRIEPLNLLDPAESNFTPNGCRTLHDITRFIHEKAVDELIDLSYYHNHHQESISGKLVWDIPLNLVLIDIGGGLTQGVSKKITLDQITSIPMKALLAGLAHPKAWDSTPLSVDMGSFMSSLTKTVSPELSGNRKSGQNLAVISDVYANLNLQLGYHFTVIDTYLTENINDNYAHFRFYGGVTESRRRCRRAKFLERVLESHDFRVDLQDDLVIARVKKIDKKNMLKHLHILGLLVGFTRQLDVEMVSEQSINDAIEKFNLLMEAVDEE